MSTLPLLYSFRRCPYAIRARMAMMYAQIEANIIEVSLKDKPQKMLDYSPKATVPVLVLDDNNIMDESRDIMLWSMTISDPDNWYVDLSCKQQKVITEAIEQNDNVFKPLLDDYKYSSRNNEYSEEQLRRKAEPYLAQLNEFLECHQYLMSDQVSLADIAIFPFIRQFAECRSTGAQQINRCA